MAGCITSDYKTILMSLLDSDTQREMITAIVNTIPLCTAAPAASSSAVAAAKSTRRMAEPWGIEPIYVDETGKETKFSSPSAVVKFLALPMSGIQCDVEGQKCKALSVVEILRVHGYTVTGNGEPKKAGEGGKKMIIYHPMALKE